MKGFNSGDGIGDNYKMMFIISKSYDLTCLPNPNYSKIAFEKPDEKVVAAIQFNGWTEEDKIEKNKSILNAE